MNQTLFLMSGAALALGCVGARGEPASPSTPLEWAVDRFVWEYAREPFARGRIQLDVRSQNLRFTVRDQGRDVTFNTSVRDELPGFVAVTFTQLAGGELLLGGYDPSEGTARFARLRLTSSGTASHEILRVDGPEFKVASALTGLRDGRRVAVLDHVTDRLFVLHLESLRLQDLVVGVPPPPGLASARYVHVRPIEGSDGGVVILATEVNEEGLGMGRLSGKRARFADQDGDGTFESVQ